MEKSKSNLHICLFVCMYFAFKNGAVTLFATKTKRNDRRRRKKKKSWALSYGIDGRFIFKLSKIWLFSCFRASPFTVSACELLLLLLFLFFSILIELFWQNTNLHVSVLHFVRIRCAKILGLPAKRNTLDWSNATKIQTVQLMATQIGTMIGSICGIRSVNTERPVNRIRWHSVWNSGCPHIWYFRRVCATYFTCKHASNCWKVDCAPTIGKVQRNWAHCLRKAMTSNSIQIL